MNEGTKEKLEELNNIINGVEKGNILDEVDRCDCGCCEDVDCSDCTCEICGCGS